MYGRVNTWGEVAFIHVANQVKFLHYGRKIVRGAMEKQTHVEEQQHTANRVRDEGGSSSSSSSRQARAQTIRGRHKQAKRRRKTGGAEKLRRRYRRDRRTMQKPVQRVLLLGEEVLFQDHQMASQGADACW